jgi:hypothetical protein
MHFHFSSEKQEAISFAISKKEARFSDILHGCHWPADGAFVVQKKGKNRMDKSMISNKNKP